MTHDLRRLAPEDGIPQVAQAEGRAPGRPSIPPARAFPRVRHNPVHGKKVDPLLKGLKLDPARTQMLYLDVIAE